VSIAATIDAAQQIGVCTNESWLWNLKKLNVQPNDEPYSEANDFTAATAMKIQLHEQDLKECLANGYPFAFGLRLTRQFMKCGPSGIIKVPDANTNPLFENDPSGNQKHHNHALLAVGYDDTKRFFIVRNSWGTSYGKNGFCFLPYDYLCNLEYSSGASVVWAVKRAGDDALLPVYTENDYIDDLIEEDGEDDLLSEDFEDHIPPEYDSECDSVFDDDILEDAGGDDVVWDGLAIDYVDDSNVFATDVPITEELAYVVYDGACAFVIE